jgi:ATP-binding cassette, subfamily C, bacterial
MTLLPVASAAPTRRLIRRLLRPHRRVALAGSTLLTAATGAGLVIPPLLGRVVDTVAAGRGSITVPIVAIVLLAVTQGVLTGFGTSLVARLGESVLASLRERFVDRALRLPLDQVERAGSGDLTSRVTVDVTVVAEAVRDALPRLAQAALTIGLTLAGLAVLDWRFLLAALLAVPIQVHTVRWYVRRAVPLYAAQRVAAGAQQQQQLSTVGGASTVRAFGLADSHLRLVTRRSSETVDLTLRGVGLVTRFYGRLNLAEYVGLTAILATGFWLVRGDWVSIGTATAAALYFHNLFNPINIVLGLVDDVQASLAALSRLAGVAELEPASAARATGSHGVEISGVSHAYTPGHDVLRDITLSIAPGERVALVGASGAGKSTLAKLVAGIHQPAKGTVRVSGEVALISQEVHVFAGPLADDLRLACPSATDPSLRSALARVGALDWAEALPDGLSTVVGEGGHRLTPAQAQQLALARLVLADPPVVVLDEATAEAGSAGAKTLEAAVARAIAGRTALIVAHRLPQAAAADRIVVLDSGRITETGAHSELVEAAGAYAALWTAWTTTRAAEAH